MSLFRRPSVLRIPCQGICLVVLFVWTGSSKGQSAAIYNRAQPAPYQNVPTIRDVSLIRLQDPVPFRLHDLIQIKIDERVQLRNTAQANKRKNTQFLFTFNDFVVILAGLRLRADQAIRSQRPAVQVGDLQNGQSQYQFFRNDRFQATITAEVVEIKPNGNLVIEANGVVRVNNEETTYKLSGIVSPLDVDFKARSIASDRIASKRVEMYQAGPTRDAYRRGFITRAIDMFLPY